MFEGKKALNPTPTHMVHNMIAVFQVQSRLCARACSNYCNTTRHNLCCIFSVL